MKRNIRLLAVSRMQGGVCIAGIAEHSGSWVRPIRQMGYVTVADLQHGNGEQMVPLDLVGFNLVKRSPSPPHIEDWVVDFSAIESVDRPQSEKTRARLLAELAEPSPDDVLIHKTRSLVMIEPDQIDMTSFDPHAYGGTYKVRLSFSLNGQAYQGEAKKSPGYPVTDIRLRNWGRRYRTRKVLNDAQLRESLGVEKIYLVLGLARSMEGNNWPMVVGFHTVPDHAGKFDFSNP